MTDHGWKQLKIDLREEIERDNKFKNHYQKLHTEHLLAEDIHDVNVDQDVPSNGSLVSKIRGGEWEQNDQLNQLPAKFHKSLCSSKRGEFLTSYSINELSKMRLFLVKGSNAGFAIKSDGDIVAVHNNSGSRGIGQELIKQAIKNGGKKLDHFDGFLHGFYSKLGFKVVKRDLWNDEYAPSDWKYQAINIFDPEYSSYAKDLSKYKDKMPIDIKEHFLKISENELKRVVYQLGHTTFIPKDLLYVITNYKSGRPSIIYQTL